MKMRFNRYERVAGLFVITAIVGCIGSVVGLAVKKGWFEARLHYETTLKSAEGIHEGTQVQMAGLRAGRVATVTLKNNREVHVRLEVLSRFADRIREDSVVRVLRPFIIGDKVIDISVGNELLPIAKEGRNLASESTSDIMDLFSGRTLAPSLESISKMTENLRVVAEALFDPERSKQIIEIFDGLQPLVKNMNSMSGGMAQLLKQANGKNQLGQVVNNLLVLTNEVSRALPAIAQESPELARDLAKIARNMAVLTEEVQGTLPLMKELGPELPRASRRAIEALDETVVTLKALQKSFLLRGSVRDVREEESLRERMPASAPAPVKPTTNEKPQP